MAHVALYIEDLASRITVKALLEAEGHVVGGEGDAPEVAIVDDLARAVSLARDHKVLLLSPVGEIADAVATMYKGVYGYISLPLQPGEVAIMVERAMGSGNLRTTPSSAKELRSLEEMEAEHILNTLRACKHNQARAARALGIGRNTLWRKLKKIRGDEGENASGT